MLGIAAVVKRVRAIWHVVGVYAAVLRRHLKDGREKIERVVVLPEAVGEDAVSELLENVTGASAESHGRNGEIAPARARETLHRKPMIGAQAMVRA